MKSRLLRCLTAVSLFASFATPVPVAAQGEVQAKKQLTRYTVTDLGLTPFAFPGINNRGLVAGTALSTDGMTSNAFLWQKGMRTDLGTLGGPNSAAFSRPNERGEVVGNAETMTPDPLGEDFCAYGTHLICLAFVWQNGTMTPLATLGGNNGWANGGVNNRGQVAGFAENATLDATCPVPSLEAKPVIWTNGTARELPTLPGDPDGAVSAINERGQAVGDTSDCAPTTRSHAVLWSEDGSVTDLGSLGGTLNNFANDINNHGQVVGVSGLPGNTGASHAFLWTARDGMRDLGAGPPGTDLFASAAFGINDNGQVVGWSCDQTPDCGGWIWQDGVMTDLTSLLPHGSPWNVIAGTSINSRGEVAAFGDIAGVFHALLLTPCNEAHPDSEGCDDSLVDAKIAPAAQAAAGTRDSKLSATGQARGLPSSTLALPVAPETTQVRQLLLRRLGFGRFMGSVFQVTSDAAVTSGSSATLSPASLTFSTQAVGTTSAADTVVLKNTGTTSLTISSIAITGTDPADFAQAHTCGSSLAAGASCNINVTFRPKASGTRTAVLSVTDNSAGSPQKGTLAGIGTTAGLSPTSLYFAPRPIGTTSLPQPVTLTNVGATTLTVSRIAITGTNAGDFWQTHNCASSLAAGASCGISVYFKPTASGHRTAILSVTGNAAGSPQGVSLGGGASSGGCVPIGHVCYGPGPNRCCQPPPPSLHHAYCSNPTGWGTCVEN